MSPVTSAHTAPDNAPPTLGALRAAGHTHRTVKAEVRENLLARLRSGDERFPGILGFSASVLPRLERALLAGHDIVLLGERGQGKSRLIRTLTGLLDAWSPVVDGCPINDHPYAPVCARCRRLAAETGDDLPVAWVHRWDRYGEKLCTPDTGVGDLIGDIDPIRLAEGRSLGDPESVHYGLVPRANRGVFCLNELPDLPARIQVGLFNVLEERDVQVRGFALRLPLDMLLVASANPEDYTNRGRIITPLKDRFGAEIRTHYPREVEDEAALILQEAAPSGDVTVPRHLVEVVARFTRLVRESSSVDARSGVSARFAIAGIETAAAAAERRAALIGEQRPVARVCDLPPIVETLVGKVEFDAGEEGRETEVLSHLLRRATAETFRHAVDEATLAPLADLFADGTKVDAGERVSAAELLSGVGAFLGLDALVTRVEPDQDSADPKRYEGYAAAVLEFAMEGLYLNRRLSKEQLEDHAVYRT
ncbi:magnesium chelatase [Nocardiopsis gilva YIM 90087]|uniref:Magnesium chelatase n=1 Tax=Nocardiopsis gilva YIM 90087 TaxID=1235441 RepID=A0A223S303_9ACTN|nr:sigma 54-interacting transcriptional regulator [Nocardiopsis gilva]ASU82501.1 magnesium chelatase [Nocardiopsis gilva YIM 90087]